MLLWIDLCIFNSWQMRSTVLGLGVCLMLYFLDIVSLYVEMKVPTPSVQYRADFYRNGSTNGFGATWSRLLFSISTSFKSYGVICLLWHPTRALQRVTNLSPPRSSVQLRQPAPTIVGKTALLSHFIVCSPIIHHAYYQIWGNTRYTTYTVWRDNLLSCDTCQQM